MKILRLLQSQESSSLGEAAQSLGYSWRHCQRWFATYRRDGLSELLVSRIVERAPSELVTEEAFKEMEETMKRGQIATVSQAHRFLWERGVHYSHPESVGGLRRSLSNRMFESVEALQQALTRVLEPYWAEPAPLKRLTGYSWWVEAVESL